MKVSRSEAIRQFRARGGALIESAARQMAEQLPEDLEVGHEFAILLPLQIEEPPVPLSMLAGDVVHCEGDGCRSSIEFPPDMLPGKAVSEVERRGWRMSTGLLSCPRCIAAVAPRSS